MYNIIIFTLILSGLLVYVFLAIELFKRILKFLFPGNGSGSGYNFRKKEFYTSLKLKRSPDSDDIIGKGFHRSGWPKVIDKLSVFNDDSGILFDDFVEQTFCYSDNPPVYKEDWIGVFHHPDDIPYFGNSREKLQILFKNPEFIESTKKLRLAVSLSEKLAIFLRKNLNCEVIVLKHPVELEKFKEWNLKDWLDNKEKKIIQLGFYQRNTQLYNQIPKINGVSINRIWINKEWTNDWDTKIKSHFKNRKVYNQGEELRFQTPSKFDKLLTNNVIMTEYISISASNVILDCISRNSPLFVNPKPEVVEYLGEGYPLYFTNPEEIPNLMNKIPEAHDYLKNMNKEILSLESFCNKLMDEVEKIKK